jgi:hypothetical protein
VPFSAWEGKVVREDMLAVALTLEDMLAMALASEGILLLVVEPEAYLVVVLDQLLLYNIFDHQHFHYLIF